MRIDDSIGLGFASHREKTERREEMWGRGYPNCRVPLVRCERSRCVRERRSERQERVVDRIRTQSQAILILAILHAHTHTHSPIHTRATFGTFGKIGLWEIFEPPHLSHPRASCLYSRHTVNFLIPSFWRTSPSSRHNRRWSSHTTTPRQSLM